MYQIIPEEMKDARDEVFPILEEAIADKHQELSEKRKFWEVLTTCYEKFWNNRPQEFSYQGLKKYFDIMEIERECIMLETEIRRIEMAIKEYFTEEVPQRTKMTELLVDDAKAVSCEDLVQQFGVKLRKSGRQFTGCCPLHDEKTPSFFVDPDKNVWYCQGCLYENELIWVDGRLQQISKAKVGDMVYTKNGTSAVISGVVKKQLPCMEVTIGSNHEPLRLTQDHTCLIVPSEELYQAVPWIRYEKPARRLKFYGRMKIAKPTSRYKELQDQLKLVEYRADQLRINDYVCFPVLENRISSPSYDLIQPNKKGPVPKVGKIVVDEELAWVMGLWVAEGSFGGRSVFWTLNIKEEDFANRVQNCLEKFGFRVSQRARKSKNTLDVECNSVTLGNLLVKIFGKLAAHKSIPFELLQWSKDLQIAFLNGYYDGDGSKNGKFKIAATISKNLAYGIYALLVQTEQPCSVKHPPNRIGHAPYWLISWRCRESLMGFFWKIQGISHYFQPITAIEHNESEPAEVVDISVDDPTESFLTGLCSTHNCHKGGDSIRFIEEVKQCDFVSAVRYLTT